LSTNYGSMKNLSNIVDANIVTNNKFYLSPVAQIQDQINTNTIDL